MLKHWGQTPAGFYATIRYWHRDCCDLRLLFPHDHLYRSSRLESHGRSGWFSLAERLGHGAVLFQQHGGLIGLLVTH